jgi:hypothetical protein
MQLVATERAGRPGAHGGALPPRGIGVAVGLALRAALVEVPLPVHTGGHVGGVDGDAGAQLGKLLVQGGSHPVKAGVQQRVAGAARPAGRRKLADEPGDLPPNSRSGCDKRVQPGTWEMWLPVSSVAQSLASYETRSASPCVSCCRWRAAKRSCCSAPTAVAPY